MPKVVVRYTVKPERAEENQRLIERVFAELAETAPEGLRYASFRLEDGVSFLHVASIDAEDGSNPLGAIEAFADFTRDIGERCDERDAHCGAAGAMCALREYGKARDKGLRVGSHDVLPACCPSRLPRRVPRTLPVSDSLRHHPDASCNAPSTKSHHVHWIMAVLAADLRRAPPGPGAPTPAS